ncbi:MAG: thymidine phosphorylase [Actinomycetia bacterium]|nr:thymidine phosphorylase [Actinomycetes bacterium]
MVEQFSAVEVIRTKRENQELSEEQINWVIGAFTRGEVADEQMSALAMAIFLNGMNQREVVQWTTAMIDSGERMDFSDLAAPTVDKHSTGGVGDKITLPLAPLVAACGAAVPQLSGRGLAHGGGTLDKMESIKGWRADLTNHEMDAILHKIGAVICAAGSGLTPADKKLYALRDVTGTVESIPLIASSIMSKKIAEGVSALILDVKTGNGAFMSDPSMARELAQTMVNLGKDAGVNTRALITAMDVPLGLAVGNALEVQESIEILQGGGPSDVRELTLALAREMLEVVGITTDPEEKLDNGQAFDRWKAMVAAQGGDNDAPLPKAKYQHTITASTDGTITRMNALAVGVAAWRLGAGRTRKEDRIAHGAGILLHTKPGQKITAGAPILTMFTDEEGRFESAQQALDETPITIGVSTDICERLPLIIERIN